MRLKILQGTARGNTSAAEPQPRPDMPVCPAWLSRAAKAEWRGLAPELHRLGLLTCLDGTLLATYCDAVATFRWAVETLRKEGHTYRREGLVKTHPANAIKNEAGRAIASL